jgi:diguanylate cyclase (GGDEF)-like protein
MTQQKSAQELAAELQALQTEHSGLAEAHEKLKERVIELYTLYKVSRTLSMSIQLNELFDLAMSVIGESLNVNQYCLMLLDEESRQLMIHAHHGMPEKVIAQGSVVKDAGVVARVVREKAPVLIRDMKKEQAFIYFPDSGIDHGSYLGVPLIAKDLKVIGVLSAHKTEIDGFSETEKRLFEAVAEHLAIAIDNALTFQKTRELMQRDDLTNLYNRRYFFERLEREVYRARRYGRTLSLLMVDIDHFKNFNDTYGHLRGDSALARIARLLETNLRKADLVARYGGEEFLALLPETSKDDAAKVGDKLRSETAKLDFNDDAPHLGPAQLTITVGVASMPTDTDDALVLLDFADKALYFGKARGRNQVCVSLPENSSPGHAP